MSSAAAVGGVSPYLWPAIEIVEENPIIILTAVAFAAIGLFVIDFARSAKNDMAVLAGIPHQGFAGVGYATHMVLHSSQKNT